MTTHTIDLADARRTAAGVVDPEMPMLTLEDLGVLREVVVQGDTVLVTITPTYSGCPAMATMRDDLQIALRRDGFEHSEIRVSLEPAWTSDWITERGRAALHEAGLSTPAHVGARRGPIPLTLTPMRRDVRCPRCASAAVTLTSEFGSTACKALYRCEDCGEPFDHVKEI